MSLICLVEHYEHCLSRMRHREAELDSIASQSVPFTPLNGSLIEKYAARIFTPTVFKKVKVEIIKSMEWDAIDTIDENNLVKYVISMKDNFESIKILNCAYVESSLNSMLCPCRKMECECLPCEHIFPVLNFLKMDVIPDICVATRWTTKTKMAFPSDSYGEIYSWLDRWKGFACCVAWVLKFYLSAR